MEKVKVQKLFIVFGQKGRISALMSSIRWNWRNKNGMVFRTI